MCIAIGVLDRLSQRIEELSENINVNILDLREQLSICDRKRSDVEHFIENHIGMDACSGYKYSKQIQEIMIERRKVKNEIEALNFINHLTVIKPKISELKYSVRKLNDRQIHRKYTPKVLNKGRNVFHLNKVNKTETKIKSDNHLDRMTYLINQVASN